MIKKLLLSFLFLFLFTSSAFAYTITITTGTTVTKFENVVSYFYKHDLLNMKIQKDNEIDIVLIATSSIDKIEIED